MKLSVPFNAGQMGEAGFHSMCPHSSDVHFDVVDATVHFDHRRRFGSLEIASMPSGVRVSLIARLLSPSTFCVTRVNVLP